MSVKISINDKLELILYLNDFGIYNPKPIKYLESSIASCIGKCIISFIKDNNLVNNPFNNFKVTFSNETIKIYCEVKEEKYIKSFHEIIDECYIMNILNINKNITVEYDKKD